MRSLHFIRGGLVSCSTSLILNRVVALLSRKPQCHREKKEIEDIGGETNYSCDEELLTQTHSQALSLAAPSSHQEDRTIHFPLPRACCSLQAAGTGQPSLGDGGAPAWEVLTADWLRWAADLLLECPACVYLNHRKTSLCVWAALGAGRHHPWQGGSAARAQKYTHLYIYICIDIHPYAHTEVCLHIHLLREKHSPSALPRLLTDGLGSEDEAVLWHKISPSMGRVRHTPPLCSLQPLPCNGEADW